MSQLELTLEGTRPKSDAFMIAFAILKLADVQEKQTAVIKDASARIAAGLNKIASVAGGDTPPPIPARVSLDHWRGGGIVQLPVTSKLRACVML